MKFLHTFLLPIFTLIVTLSLLNNFQFPDIIIISPNLPPIIALHLTLNMSFGLLWSAAIFRRQVTKFFSAFFFWMQFFENVFFRFFFRSFSFLLVASNFSHGKLFFCFFFEGGGVSCLLTWAKKEKSFCFFALTMQIVQVLSRSATCSVSVTVFDFGLSLISFRLRLPPLGFFLFYFWLFVFWGQFVDVFKIRYATFRRNWTFAAVAFSSRYIFHFHFGFFCFVHSFFISFYFLCFAF